MIIDTIVKRRSVRSFKKDKVTDEQIREMIIAGEMAPSAKGNHGIEYIVIHDQKVKNQLSESLGQPFIKEAPVLIIPFLKTELSIAPIQDISVATENIFLQAVSMGLGTVWKNVNIDQVESVKKILKLGKEYTIINLIPVGYSVQEPQPHNLKNFQEKKFVG
jgi:nitroreductase